MADTQDFDSLWNYSNPSETRTKFEALKPKLDSKQDQNQYYQLMTQIARTYSLEGKFEKAHQTLDQVEKVLSKASTMVKVRYFLERGRTYNSSKDKDKAKSQFKKAYELAKTEKLDIYTIDAAHMMAIAETDHAVKRKWNHLAIDIAENSQVKKAQKWLGSLYNNLGWDYHDNQQFLKALPLFIKAQEFHQKSGNEQRVFIAKWTVARCYRSLNKIDEALKIQLSLQETMNKKKKPDGYVHEELAELYYVLKKDNLARDHFKESFQLLSQDKWLVKNEPERIKRLKKMAGL